MRGQGKCFELWSIKNESVPCLKTFACVPSLQQSTSKSYISVGILTLKKKHKNLLDSIGHSA